MEKKDKVTPRTPITKFTQALKDLWIKGLRSGKYEQGRGFLNREGKFCCLGVLCEVAGWRKIEVAWTGIISYLQEDYPGDWTTITPDKFLDCHFSAPLAKMNDEQGKDFNQIADWIEENVKVNEDEGDHAL